MNPELYWKWAVRTVGLLGFLTLLIMFALGREIPTAFLVLVGGMIGLEPILNWRGKGDA